MPKNLLLADDSITIQKVVGITFAKEDYQVTAVDNGEEALQRAREAKPDIILADVVMPRRNGYELCEAVKADPELRDIPVVLLAGTFEAFDEARAREVGADGHIAKPFESQTLINKVRELVEGVAPPPAVQPLVRPAAAAPVPAARPAAPPAPPTPAFAPPPPAYAPVVGSRPPGPAAPGQARPPVPGPAARPPAPAMPQRPVGPPPGMGARPGIPPPAGTPGMAPRPPAQAAPPRGMVPSPGRPPFPAARPPPPAQPAGRPTTPQAGPQVGPRPAPPVARPAHAPAPPPRPVPPRDPYGLGAMTPVPARPPPAREDDWSDVDVVAEAAEAIEEAPAPAFAPPAEAAARAAAPHPGPRPAAGDGGEARLREALSQASREVIERVVWEVVPQLAETIIRENLDRLVNQRQNQ